MATEFRMIQNTVPHTPTRRPVVRLVPNWDNTVILRTPVPDTQQQAQPTGTPWESVSEPLVQQPPPPPGPPPQALTTSLTVPWPSESVSLPLVKRANAKVKKIKNGLEILEVNSLLPLTKPRLFLDQAGVTL